MVLIFVIFGFKVNWTFDFTDSILLWASNYANMIILLIVIFCFQVAYNPLFGSDSLRVMYAMVTVSLDSWVDTERDESLLDWASFRFSLFRKVILVNSDIIVCPRQS